MNEVSLVRDGSIYWNGDRVSREQLALYLAGSHGLHPEPDVFLQTETGVSCHALETLRDRMDQALECKKSYSHCAEGIKEVWRNMPMKPGTHIS